MRMTPRHVLSSAALATALLGFGSIRAAHAGFLIPIDPGLFCTAPTATECRTASYYQTLCGRMKANDCGATVLADYQANRSSLPESRSVRVPEGLPGAGTAQTVPAKPFDKSTDILIGHTATASGRALNLRADALDDRPFSLSPRVIWMLNGPRVTSCEEYAAEKFNDWTLYEDTVEDLGQSWGQIFVAAVESGKPLADGVVNSLNGAPVHNLYLDTKPRPKTPFHTQGNTAAWYGTAGELWQANPAWKYEFDPAISAMLAGGQSWTPPSYSHLDFWAYVAALAPSNDDWDLLARKEQAWRDLWNRRRALQQTMNSCLALWGKPELVTQCGMSSTNPTGTDFVNTFQWQLIGIDYQLERLALEMKDLNCFSSDHMTWCDFTPRRFFEDIAAEVRAAREASFQNCMRLTSNSFSSGLMAKVRSTGAPEVGFPQPFDMTQSTAVLDFYLWKVESYIRSLEFDIDPQTRKPSVKKQIQDQGSLGSSLIGASYSYSGGWHLYNFENNVLLTQGSAQGALYADASLLGVKIPIINAYAMAQTVGDDTTPTGVTTTKYLRLLNNEAIYQPPTTESASFNIVLDAAPVSRELAGGSQVIMVAFIPVELRAGVAGQVGASGSLRGNITRGSSIALNLHGDLRPWAAATGFVYGAASVGIVKAGIKATLTLIRAELPFNLDAKLAMGGDGNITFDATASLDLVLRTLDGRVSAFIDYFLDDAEVTLFEWQGLADTVRLFESHWDGVPIGAMQAGMKLNW